MQIYAFIIIHRCTIVGKKRKIYAESHIFGNFVMQSHK